MSIHERYSRAACDAHSIMSFVEQLLSSLMCTYNLSTKLSTNRVYKASRGSRAWYVNASVTQTAYLPLRLQTASGNSTVNFDSTRK